MFLDELLVLLDRHARPDLTTAIDGVRLCKVDALFSGLLVNRGRLLDAPPEILPAEVLAAKLPQ
jgi:hypothetical protein